MTKTAKRPEIVENITVLQVGQYGVRVDEKTWFGVNEPLLPTSFEKGNGYKVSITVSKTGKKYISEILGVESASAPAATPAASAPAPATSVAAPASTPAQPANKTTPAEKSSTRPMRAGYGQPLTEYDLATQRLISRAGVYQAALASSVLGQWVANPDEYIALVRKVADAGMQYISE